MPNPTLTERLNALEPRIAEIERVLVLKPRQPSLAPLRRLWNSVLAHPTASAASTLLVFFIGVAATQGKGWFDDAVEHRVENTVKDRGGVIEKLDKLQTTTDETNATLRTLQPFIQDLIRHQFESASKLSPQDLSKRLPALGDLADAAINQTVVIDPKITEEVTKTLLRTDVHAIGYWPTAAKIISLKSSGVSDRDQTRLPDCADILPSLSRLLDSVSPGLQTFRISGRTYENCVFTLDSKRDDDTINNMLVKSASYLVFKHCVIVFRGGPINLIVEADNATRPMTIGGEHPETVMVPYSGHTIILDSCLLHFSLPASPSPEIQKIAQSLLAQNGPSLTLANP